MCFKKCIPLLSLLCERDYQEVVITPPARKSQSFDVSWLGLTFLVGQSLIFSCAFCLFCPLVLMLRI